jgi:hypothetical protein
VVIVAIRSSLDWLSGAGGSGYAPAETGSADWRGGREILAAMVSEIACRMGFGESADE